MDNLQPLIADFDTERRILHITSDEPVLIDNERMLNAACSAVDKSLREVACDERCYMIVDISKIVIDPSLVDSYSRKVKSLIDKYLYPGGLVRYGFQITRVTAQLGHSKKMLDEPALTRTLDEAYDYIKKMKQNASAKIE